MFSSHFIQVTKVGLCPPSKKKAKVSLKKIKTREKVNLRQWFFQPYFLRLFRLQNIQFHFLYSSNVSNWPNSRINCFPVLNMTWVLKLLHALPWMQCISYLSPHPTHMFQVNGWTIPVSTARLTVWTILVP